MRQDHAPDGGSLRIRRGELALRLRQPAAQQQRIPFVKRSGHGGKPHLLLIADRHRPPFPYGYCRILG